MVGYKIDVGCIDKKCALLDDFVVAVVLIVFSDRQIDRQINRQIDRIWNRQIDRQIENMTYLITSFQLWFSWLSVIDRQNILIEYRIDIDKKCALLDDFVVAVVLVIEQNGAIVAILDGELQV